MNIQFGSRRTVRIMVVLILGAAAGCANIGGASVAKVLTDDLSAPLGEAKSALVDINTASGNLTIDWLTTGEQLLASGTLEYLENQDVPSRSVKASNGQATLAVKAAQARQPWFRFPWDACNGATEWKIHLNPTVLSDLTVHTGGGNVKLNLAGMAVTRLAADTGGGNLDVVLPAAAANLNAGAKTGGGNVTVEIGGGTTGSSTVSANSGAGNVVVRVPSGLAARIHASSGMGKVIVDPRFVKIDGKTYQSPDYESAANKVDIRAGSGAGNVSVN